MIRHRKVNRRRGPRGLVFPAPLAVILGFAAVVSLSYLWVCGRCEDLGVQIQKLEGKKAEVHRRVINEEYKWSNMKSPQNIERLMQHFKLAMTWPEEARVARVRGGGLEPEAPVEDAAARPQFAQHTGTIVND